MMELRKWERLVQGENHRKCTSPLGTSSKFLIPKIQSPTQNPKNKGINHEPYVSTPNSDFP
jgi:hypothetical protein